MHANVADFTIRGRLTRIFGHFRAQGSALTRNVSSPHGSKNLLQRAILYRHEKILLGREDCRPGPKKTICKNLMVFFIDFSGSINSFGLALCVASDMDVLLLWFAAGPPRKSICERLSCTKVTSMHEYEADFMIRGRLTRILGPFRAQGSSLTRNVSSSHGSKNLRQRAILYRHEKILLGREDCRPGPKKSICKQI